MTTQDKRFPALSDTDPMPFGKHKGEQLIDVPAKYLHWLWGELKQDGYNKNHDFDVSVPSSIQEKQKLANYIWNSQDAIEQECGETIR